MSTGLIDQNGNPLVAQQRVTEGAYRPGPYVLPISNGWLSADVGQYWNYWQMGYDVESYGTSAMVEACISAYAQTVAMCPGDHWRGLDNGGRERIKNSALSRILRRPNTYQTISDFLLDAVYSLYHDGNAYALALRNDRYEISELHLMEADNVFVSEDGEELFYELSGNEVIDARIEGRLIVPMRDVLHVKLATKGELTGSSPLLAAAAAISAGNAMMQQQIAYYLNQAKPSYALTTEAKLDKDQIEQLRTAWNAQSRGLNSGGTPILANGFKPVRLGGTAEEAQLADIMKLSDQQIALVFRVPLQILGIGGTPFASTEMLMQSWRNGGLGFALNHIELAFDKLFALKGPPEEYTEFSTRALMRSSFSERIAGLAQGVQSSIFSPDEARAEEELPAVPGGHGKEPRAQQQLVPLSAAGQIPEAPPAAPGAPPAAAIELPEEDETDADRSEWAREILRAADEYERRSI